MGELELKLTPDLKEKIILNKLVLKNGKEIEYEMISIEKHRIIYNIYQDNLFQFDFLSRREYKNGGLKNYIDENFEELKKNFEKEISNNPDYLIVHDWIKIEDNEESPQSF